MRSSRGLLPCPTIFRSDRRALMTPMNVSPRRHRLVTLALDIAILILMVACAVRVGYLIGYSHGHAEAAATRCPQPEIR